MIGPINLDTKWTGARSAGDPHAACDREGAGDGSMASRTEVSRSKGTTIATGSLPKPRQSSTLLASSANSVSKRNSKKVRTIDAPLICG